MGVNVLIRNRIADYFDTGDGGVAAWTSAGAGFNTLDENPSAQSDTKAYINDASATTTVKSYQPQFPFDVDLTSDDPIINKFYDFGTRRYVGGDVVMDYIRVELWRPDTTGTGTNVYKARKMTVAVVVDGIAGAGGEVIHVTGNLQGIGDPVDGTFDTAGKIFTEDVVTTAQEERFNK